MKLTVIFLLLTVSFGRCTTITPQTANVSPDELIIRAGTSFGYCVGYCNTDYVFNGTSVTLTQTSFRQAAQYPAKTCQNTISAADWNTLKSQATLDTFSKVAEQLGCPDCADAGAEYVELQLGDQKHRVTFETARTIPGFEPLVDAVRKQRDAFRQCP